MLQNTFQRLRHAQVTRPAPQVIADLNTLEQQTGRVAQQPVAPPRDVDRDSDSGDQSSASSGEGNNRDASNREASSREARNAQDDLRAELEGVRAALADGRTQAARSRLDAFRNQLETLHRTGRISDDLYQQLSVAALRLRDDINPSPTNVPSSRRETPQATNAPRRTPTPQPRRSTDNNNQDANTPAQPTTVAAPTVPTAPPVSPTQVQPPR